MILKSPVSYQIGAKKTPVTIFAFNRPELTARVFDAIRRWEPERLFIVTDGPREYFPKECDEVQAILNKVDWPCDVQKEHSHVNLGCRRRMISGISWVLSQVDESILLEDDCLPAPSFFPFASEMLSRYRDSEEIMMVSGSNLVASERRADYTYSFARSIGIWGWGTWSRAWKLYDEHISQWPHLRKTNFLTSVLNDSDQAKWWSIKFDNVYAGATSWDFQWLFSVWANNGVSIVPSKNMIRNIGFTGPKYKKTPAYIQRIINIHEENIEFPLRHPPTQSIDREIDALMFKYAYSPQLTSRFTCRLCKKSINKLRKLLTCPKF